MNKEFCPYCMTPVNEGETCPICGLTAGNYVPSPHHLPLGTKLLDRYLVGRVLGEGGFGITYIGRDLRLDMKVAIKEYYPVDRATRNAESSLNVSNFLGPSAHSFERGKQRFLNEARTMARMDKQKVIVSVRDYFEENNTAYIVMEYIEGTTFKELIEQRGGRIPPEELFRILEPLFSALSELHDAGLIHRDISPENLMLENGKVRLLDFGCARESAGGSATMTVALKYDYAPVEQYNQKGQGPWTDIYALCATIYKCLTGNPPPRALDRITDDTLIPPSRLGVAITPQQERGLLRGLRVQPGRRYRTIEELWAALYAEELEVTTDDEDPAEADVGQDTQTTDADALKEPRTTRKSLTWKHYALIAAGAALVIALIIGIARGSGGTPAALPAAEAETAEAVLETALPTAAPAEGSGEPADQAEETFEALSFTDPDELFVGAAVMTEWDRARFDELMNDDSVPAIVLDIRSNFLMNEEKDISTIRITKPVKLSEDIGFYQIPSVSLEERGFLYFAGDVDEVYHCKIGFMRLTGDGQRLLFGGSWANLSRTVVWADSETCLGNLRAVTAEAPPQIIICSASDLLNGRTVTTAEELMDAAQGSEPIVISGEIITSEPVRISVPVLVSQGSTLYSNEENGPAFFEFTGPILVNCGQMYGSVQGSAALVNYGLLGQVPNVNDGCDLALGSAVVNLGELFAAGNSVFQDNNLCNAGTMYVYGIDLCGVCCSNYGQLVVRGELGLYDGTVIYSGAASDMWLEEDGVVRNWGVVTVGGGLVLNPGTSWENMITVVDAALAIQEGAAWNEGLPEGADGSILYGGEIDTIRNLPEDQTAYRLRFDIPDEGLSVYSPEELTAALNDPDTSVIIAETPILMGEDLYISGKQVVFRECLIMQGDAKLTLENGRIFGEITASQAELIDNETPMFGGGRGSLHLREGGTLTLSHSMINSICGSDIGEGATVILRDDAVLLWEDAQIGSAEILVENGAALALLGDADIGSEEKTPTITLNGGALDIIGGDKTLRDARLTLENGGCVRSSASLSLIDCTVAIDESSRFVVRESDLNLLGSTVVENHGLLELSGFSRYRQFHWYLEGSASIVNTGLMNIDLLPDERSGGTITNAGDATSSFPTFELSSAGIIVEGVPVASTFTETGSGPGPGQ